jgi:hypothetical protein
MKRIVSLQSRRIGRVAASVGLGLAAFPIVLGVVAQPASAATHPASASDPLGPIVAEIDCAVQWQIYDIASTINGLASTAPTPGAPFCADPLPLPL